MIAPRKNVILMRRPHKRSSRRTQDADQTRRGLLPPGLRAGAVLLLVYFLASCTPRPAADGDKAGGFYGGVSGGMSRP